MIKFFRHIRQRMIKENRVSKYMLYAIGEIALVMIGILLALQVNTWNEGRKKDAQRDQYRISLISELETDLNRLNVLDSAIAVNETNVSKYLELYNDVSTPIEQLAASMDSAKFQAGIFRTQAYTLSELINTGKISLFSLEEKRALTSLKNELELYGFYEGEFLDFLTVNYLEFTGSSDMLFESEKSRIELPSVVDWRLDKSSLQFRKFHNTLSSALDTYNYQSKGAYPHLRGEIEAVLAILEEKQEGS